MDRMRAREKAIFLTVTTFLCFIFVGCSFFAICGMAVEGEVNDNHRRIGQRQ